MNISSRKDPWNRKQNLAAPGARPAGRFVQPELKEKLQSGREEPRLRAEQPARHAKKPKLVKALSQLLGAIWDPQSEVDRASAPRRARRGRTPAASTACAHRRGRRCISA